MDIPECIHLKGGGYKAEGLDDTTYFSPDRNIRGFVLTPILGMYYPHTRRVITFVCMPVEWVESNIVEVCKKLKSYNDRVSFEVYIAADVNPFYGSLCVVGTGGGVETRICTGSNRGEILKYSEVYVNKVFKQLGEGRDAD